MANYSDLTIMFNIRHWFEFENNTNLGLDSITGSTLLSALNVSQAPFKEDPDLPGYPTVGNGLSLLDPAASIIDSNIKILDLNPIFNTGTDSLAITTLFNFVDNDYISGVSSPYGSGTHYDIFRILTAAKGTIQGIIYSEIDSETSSWKTTLKVHMIIGDAIVPISNDILIDKDDINSLTFSLERIKVYNNEHDFNDGTNSNNEDKYEHTLSIPGATYLNVRIESVVQYDLKVIIDIYDKDNNLIHSCEGYSMMDDVIRVPGDLARIIVRGVDGDEISRTTHVTVTDQDGNEGPFLEKNIFKAYLDGVLITKEESDIGPLDITDIVITNGIDIPNSFANLLLSPFPGKISELIITDALSDANTFRLHSIMKGLFHEDTLDTLAVDNNAYIWHKFTNKIKITRNNAINFYSFEEIHKVNADMSYNVYDYIRSKEYKYSLSCPYAYHNPRSFGRTEDYYNISIDTYAWVRPPGNKDIVDIQNVQYSTFLVHMHPEGSNTDSSEGNIFYIGSGSYSMMLSVNYISPSSTYATLKFQIREGSPRVNVEYEDVLPLGAPVVIYLALDENIMHLAVNGKTLMKAAPSDFGLSGYWYNILRHDRRFMGISYRNGYNGTEMDSPAMAISDYIYYERPLSDAEIKRTSSVYHAGDPSYSLMEGQEPTYENMEFLNGTNHRLNLSEPINRGFDSITGRRLPIAISGNRYKKIPGFPHIEGVIIDGPAEDRHCVITRIGEYGWFSTRQGDTGIQNNGNAFEQYFNIGTLIYHDDLKKINVFRWSGKKDPDKNWIEVIAYANGSISAQLSVDGVESDLEKENTESNFGINTFFISITLEVESNRVKAMIYFNFTDRQEYLRPSVYFSSTEIDESYFINNIVIGSTLEIGGGPNMNQYMDSNYNLSGIMSDIFFFKDNNFEVEDARHKSNKQLPPSQYSDRNMYTSAYGKGASSSGMRTKQNLLNPGSEDILPISGDLPALIISETNKFQSPLLSMRPIVDVRVDDSFGDASYPETYLVPIPSCSSADLTLLKLFVDPEYLHGDDRAVIADGGLYIQNYWDKEEENDVYQDLWRPISYHNSYKDMSYHFSSREGIVYDFVKYNGKIAFSFLARYIETDKDTSYGDINNHHNEYRGKRLYHYNHVGYIDPAIFGDIKNGYKYLDDGSNGELGLLRANRNNGFIHLAANNPPNSFNMSNFITRLAAASPYNELCQHPPYECPGSDDYGGEYT